MDMSDTAPRSASGGWDNSGPPAEYPGSWWADRRLLFNIGLLASGAVAFLSYAVLLDVVPDQGLEINIFFIPFQMVVYAVYMGMANVCYYLGAFVERRVAVSQREVFRRRAFAAGCALAFGVPFLVPLNLIVRSLLIVWRGAI